MGEKKKKYGKVPLITMWLLPELWRVPPTSICAKASWWLTVSYKKYSVTCGIGYQYKAYLNGI